MRSYRLPNIATLPADIPPYVEQVVELGRASPQNPWREVRYGPHPRQCLHIYRPDNLQPPAQQPLPLLVFLHGGAWIQGDLDWLRFMAPAVTLLPAIFVAATYRLAPAQRWPAQLEDACQILHTAQSHAADWGGDPERIVLGGHSAGGHLATLAALRTDTPGLQACFPVSAPLDLRYGNVAPDLPEARVYRYLLSERSQDADASPIYFIDRARIPFHVIWGEHDFTRITKSGLALVTALQQQQSPVSLEVVPEASHFATHLMLSNPDDPWYAQVTHYLYPKK